MRLGVSIPADADVGAAAVDAERVGIPFVVIHGAPGTEAVRAAEAAVVTTSVRIAVVVRVGEEHPTTIAEEMAVVDNVSNGRMVVIADVDAAGDVDATIEDVAVLRAAWSGRPVALRGRRWQVPADQPLTGPPHSVMVTPAPAQLSMPLWLVGRRAAAVGAALGVPVLVDSIADIDPAAPVAPAWTELVDSVDVARDSVIDWADAGATHLAATLGDELSLEDVARLLLPEVAMVDFPRIVTQTPLPAPWPTS